MIARGGVEARYQGRTLRADEVVYDTKTEVVTAHGHVTLINADGTAQFANDMTMDKDLKAGFARGFSARLDKNIKIAADSAVRRNEQITELNKAIYTPCEVCAEKPKPTWSISGRQGGPGQEQAPGLLPRRDDPPVGRAAPVPAGVLAPRSADRAQLGFPGARRSASPRSAACL
jgi:hypothetical protein